MQENNLNNAFTIKQATKDDVPLILSFIRELAEYEQLLHEVVATEQILLKSLFGDNPRAEALIGFNNELPSSFVIYFYNYSTFFGRPGIYIEDLYVRLDLFATGCIDKSTSYVRSLW